MTEPTTTSQSADSDPDLPALLGGRPLRAQGPPTWPIRDDDVIAAANECLADGSWGRYHGPNCEALTNRLQADHACRHAVLCSSGTVAVELALRGLRVGPGDEVVLAAYDFKGNFQNVLTVGALPVLVDLNPYNWNLNVDLLADAISPATKAILVSHLHGGCVCMPRVMEIARLHGVPVIEDACQMPGSVLFGQKAGRCGDVGIFSFGGSKLLSAGRGGALITDRDDVVQRLRLYSLRGNEAYPLSELQAAVLLPQFEKLDVRNAKRTRNIAHLRDLLASESGLTLFHNPEADETTQPGYYKLGLQYDGEAFSGLSREDFVQAMRAEGIAVDAGFRALHATHGRRRYRAAGSLTVADDADRSVLVLHHPLLLEEEDDLAEIVTALDKIRRHATIIVNR